MRILIIVFSSFFLFSCDILLDEALDCINNDEPQFDQGSFPNATLNQVYLATITASINNNTNDNGYNYAFSRVGALPEGLFIDFRLGRRELSIQGTPTELGTFSFTLIVIASEDESYLNFEQSEVYYSDNDRLCKNRHEQAFELTVVAE